jgi:hypothetical protein
LTDNWRKSTYSGGADGSCVEVGSTSWRKSTYSGSSGGECVEAGTAADVVLVRDTKNNGDSPVLRVSATDWKRLTAAIKG